MGDFDYEEEGFEELDSSEDAHEVIIPDGLKEGDVFIAVVGDEEFRVTVPPGFKPGDHLLLDVQDDAEVKQEGQVDPGSKKPKLKPKRQVSFTEEEPSVMLFSPELGGLGLNGEATDEALEDFGELGKADLLDIVIPDHASPGDVLELESDCGQMIEVVVPQGMEAGMTLTVESPTGRVINKEGFPEDLAPTDETAEKQDEELQKLQEENQQTTKIDILIPEGTCAGDVLEVESPTGQTIEVVVPDGAEAGMTLTVETPISKDETKASFPEEPAAADESGKKQDETLQEENQKVDNIDTPIPQGTFAGDKSDVESATAQTIEARDDTEAGMILPVENPTSKDNQQASFPEDLAPTDETAEKQDEELQKLQEENQQTTKIDILIPEGTCAGDVLEVESPTGQTIEVVVPDGMEAGMALTVESPTGQDETKASFPEELAAAEESGKKQDETLQEENQKVDNIDTPIPQGTFAGDKSDVESATAQTIEARDDTEAGMILPVENPTSKDNQQASFPEDLAPTDEAAEKQDEELQELQKENQQTTKMNILIPEGTCVGDVLEVESPTGQTIEVVVPAGMEAGMALTVESPTGKDEKKAGFPENLAPTKKLDEELQEGNQPAPKIDILIPEGTCAGDVLEVESAAGLVFEVVVPDGLAAGMTLTVESPTNKDETKASFPEELAAADESGKKQDETLQEENQKVDNIDTAIPQGTFAGDKSDVESATAQTIEVVAPDDMEAGMTLTVENLTGKDDKQASFPEDLAPTDEAAKKQDEELQELQEGNQPAPKIDILIPEGTCAGDVLEVVSAAGLVFEVVVPDGVEAGMTLTVESPTGKDAKKEGFLEFSEGTFQQSEQEDQSSIQSDSGKHFVDYLSLHADEAECGLRELEALSQEDPMQHHVEQDNVSAGEEPAARVKDQCEKSSKTPFLPELKEEHSREEGTQTPVRQASKFVKNMFATSRTASNMVKRPQNACIAERNRAMGMRKWLSSSESLQSTAASVPERRGGGTKVEEILGKAIQFFFIFLEIKENMIWISDFAHSKKPSQFRALKADVWVQTESASQALLPD